LPFDSFPVVFEFALVLAEPLLLAEEAVAPPFDEPFELAAEEPLLLETLDALLFIVELLLFDGALLRSFPATAAGGGGGPPAPAGGGGGGGPPAPGGGGGWTAASSCLLADDLDQNVGRSSKVDLISSFFSEGLTNDLSQSSFGSLITFIAFLSPMRG